jgi:hypothetical protein
MSAARQLGSHPTTAERLDRALELIAAHGARLTALEANAPDPEAVIALAAALAEMQTDIRTLQAGQQKSPDASGYASLQDAAHAVGLRRRRAATQYESIALFASLPHRPID